LNREVGRLPLFKPRDYAININSYKPPYKPIYNLL